MNSHPHNTFDSHTGSGSGSGEAETTLRLIAGLPAPEGLEERVKAGLHQTLHQAPRSASLLRWPLATRLDPTRSGSTGAGWMNSNWARSAAAAAIVFVVAGGGWEVYSRIQPAQEPKAIALPPVAAHGGFSSANAIRTPKTLNGAVLTHPLADAVAGKKRPDSAKKPVKKAKAEAAKPVAAP
ncbi:MAG TPA: hypothetical protein VMR02_20170 [Terracidiphilus sp.]|jgi:hypothetical protein|nr:hypothetical protein [Terracidiphilus sp.]